MVNFFESFGLNTEIISKVKNKYNKHSHIIKMIISSKIVEKESFKYFTR